MTEYPRAYVIPRGAGQRSTPEASRLVQWLLDNQVVVEELKQNATFDGQTFERGSYVVWMNQARRGLADTALSIGVDVSSRISILYAPPAAWSHGYLWGANVVTIPRGAAFAPLTNVITKPSHFGGGGLDPGPADRYALKIDSPTAVRTLNRLLADGVSAEIALGSFTTPEGETMPAGSAIFAGDPAAATMLAATARDAELRFKRPDGEPAVARADRGGAPHRRPRRSRRPERLDAAEPRLHGRPGLDRDDQLGADGPVARLRPCLQHRQLALDREPGREDAADRVLLPRWRLLGRGGQRGELPDGRRAAHRPDRRRARWKREKRNHLVENVGGTESPVVGAYPARDTAIVDPPTWFTAVSPSLSVDARLPQAGFFAAGLWSLDPESASAPGSPVIAHGTNTAGTARVIVFAMNPLYRADPEREWPAVATSAYWADR